MRRNLGHKWRVLKAQVLVEENYICHLCHQPGADSADHVIPVSIRPDLEMERWNLRAVHHNAGPRCNRKRGDRPLPAAVDLQTTREW